MKKNHLLGFSIAFVVLISCIGPTSTASAQNGASLYKRLGGYDALAAVTDDFITRLATDKTLGRFFVGASDNSKMRIRQLVVDQLCAATGGPCNLQGLQSTGRARHSYVLECLRRAADTSFDGYDPTKHGLGLASYTHAVALDLASAP